MQHIVLREFGLLFNEADGVLVEQNIDRAALSPLAYRILKKEVLARQNGEDRDYLGLRSYGGRECIQVRNFVGVFEPHAACQIEVLPKTALSEQDPQELRKILWKMLGVVHNLPALELDATTLDTLPDSWIEALIRLVLDAMSQLVRKGLRRHYVRCDEEATFLRGQLKVHAQLRQRPGRDHRFKVSYDQFLSDRPENRLLRSCLRRLSHWSRSFENKRLCRELLFATEEIPSSSNVIQDLARWSRERNMVDYQPLLPWVRLILANQSPVFSHGSTEGISLLFPMERLFEEYLANTLKHQLVSGYRLKAQASSQYLINQHNGTRWFQLQPDLVILRGSRIDCVLDTKWKLLDSSKSSSRDKYDLKQSDLYQLYAYGQKYLEGEGDVFLIYPRHPGFNEPLPVFDFDGKLRLWVVPFDLENSRLNLSAEMTPAWASAL